MVPEPERLERLSVEEKRALAARLLREQTIGACTGRLSYAQRALWLLSQVNPDSPVYNLLHAAPVGTPVTAAALRRACQRLVDRHAMLRTTYSAEAGEPIQRIHAQMIGDFAEVDATTLDAAGVLARIATEADRSFDLSSGQLLRVRLLRCRGTPDVLVLVGHHIAMDFWSLGIVLNDLRALYAAEVSGVPASLPAASHSYLEFVEQEHATLQGPRGESLWAYWRDVLQGELSTLHLPTDRPRPAFQTFVGKSLDFRFTDSLSRRLVARARAEGVTPYMLILAAFQVLLRRYADQDDVLVGSTMSSPNRPRYADTVGCFVNPVVIRGTVAENVTFRELLTSVRASVLGALAHQEFPFSLLVERLRPPRDPSRSAIYQVSFIWDKVRKADAGDGLVLQEPISIGQRGTPFDLTLTILEDAPALVGGALIYNTDLFDTATVRRMHGHLQMLLEGIVSDPTQRVADLPLMPAEERGQVLGAWNSTTRPYPLDRCVHQLFEEQVRRTPDTLAVISRRERCTYQELNVRSNRIAHYLRTRGVGPDVLVALCVERGVDMVAGLLGVLKAGGAYVPLDPSYPPDRLEVMLRDLGDAVLLTQERLLDHLPRHTGEVVCLDREWPAIEQESADNARDTDVEPHHLAYVIYTSGSSGRPKGVQIEHRSVVNLSHALRDSIYQDERGRHLRVALNGSLAFDTSVKQLIQLLDGHTLCIIPEDVRVDPAALPAYLGDNAIDVLDCTPAQLRLLLPALMGLDRPNPHHILVGGEPIDDALWRTLGTLSHRRFDNLYGPTECTVDATACRITSDVPKPTIGRPLPNTRVYVLDSRSEPVPIGVPGELVIAGVQVGRGYLNLPDQTAERFIADRFSTDGLGRSYRTGDVVRWRPDGVLEFLGRRDDQVKIRGFRVELGEIQAVLNGHPGVETSVVVARRERESDVRLVAYYVPTPGRQVAAADLNAFVKARLPEYMVPSRFVGLDVLPRTANGKVDQRLLPEPERAAEPGGSDVALDGEIEAGLATIWSALLDVGHIGRDADFFALGGHSLLVAELVFRVHEVYGVELSFADVFEAPTLASVAERITAARARARTGPVATPVLPDASLPLSFAQERFWLLSQLEPHSPAYTAGGIARLRGPLDDAVLQRCLEMVVQRHQVLRSSYPTIDDRPVQRIATAATVAVQVVDLRHLSFADSEAAVHDRADQEARRPFDLAHGPLLRAALIRTGDDDTVLILTMHHIISDGWSVGILLRELVGLYRALTTGQVVELPELSIQYVDYARWQRDWSQGDEFQSQLSFWTQQLAGAALALTLPSTRPGATRTHRGERRSAAISPSLVAALEARCRAEAVSPFVLLLTAFNIVLFQWTGQDDLVVGTVVANRGRPGLADLIGCFVNFLPLRARLSAPETGAELLARMRAIVTAGFAHQDCPFERIVAATNPDRTNRHPIYNVGFLQQGFEFLREFGDVRLTDRLRASLEFIRTPTALLDLRFIVQETHNGWRIECEYDTGLFEPQTIDALLEFYRDTIDGLTRHAELTVAQYRLPPTLVRAPRPAPLAPRTPLERTIANMVADVLGRSDLGVDVDLFAAGADLPQAAQLAARLRYALNVEIGVDDVLRCATIAGLAVSVIARKLAAGASMEDPLAALSRVSDEEARRMLEGGDGERRL